MFEVASMLRVMFRQKAQHIILMLQIAFTLAIVSNALFITQQRLDLMKRDTGINEAQLISFNQYYFGDLTNLGAQYQQDIELLQQLDGIELVTRINNIPIGDSSNNSIFSDQEKDGHAIQSGIYTGDQSLLPTLGVKLIAGRNFVEDDLDKDFEQGNIINNIVTKSFVNKLFPEIKNMQQALGKSYYSFGVELKIIGIVEKLQGGYVGQPHLEENVIIPKRETNQFQNFMVKTSGNINVEQLKQQITKTLLAADPNRVIRSIRTFEQTRQEAYSSDQMMVTLLTSLMVILVFITALGMFGSTSFQVNRRIKQIGTRRALGATKGDILGYFVGENLLLTLFGVIVGSFLAIALNQLLMQQYEMMKLPLSYLMLSLFTLMLLGMLAVLYPALKAARVSPALATRSV